ncbi:mitochondrial 37S ribosomal protein RSM19 [Verticillium alfalfae VaMs.102]|uniref:Mitochondrial ribosomal protein S19 n=1 Tax=Verticillium alfalfae (strain VaMs.102 / ATCC MYA-4576 / FGSC 10136) TaxID=526221 RepID=C9SKX0_VERA1|nr:mitochondrial 37S ribosomal protein RSM19 [Verticillium alfalfae VaMs.102]EEY19338.1 mitochondrial ribosomal protein S19 [Verticillium alfalfae VaMs.102]
MACQTIIRSPEACQPRTIRIAHQQECPTPDASPASSARSRRRSTGPHIVPLPIVRPQAGKKAPIIRTQQRSATILPNFVGLKFQIYNGKVYHDVTITEDMVGHKLGEFSP